jgi:PLP dependent protein
MSVKENILTIKRSLPSEVKLVAVSKTKSAEQIAEAYAAGHIDFGENYVQELAEKAEILPKDIRWHFIGHLQSNKVKYIAPFVHLIHGVDSLKLLGEINKQALKNNRSIEVLLQIHIATEETKFGLSFEECEALLNSENLNELRNIIIAGFMGMASNTNSEEQIKQEFLSLKHFYDKNKGNLNTNVQLQTLSMGMSSDYQLAVAAGSNMVRLGSVIFGDRIYN